jgi:Uma2 family endonuclease
MSASSIRATDSYQRLAITADTLHAMVAGGLIDEPERVELIDGDLVTMSPTYRPHARVQSKLNRIFANHNASGWEMLDGVSLRLDEYNEPMPDLCLVREGGDGDVVLPHEVGLLIEISDTTARKDRQLKAPLYARALIPELWIVDLDAGELVVHRAPSVQGWASVETHSFEATVSPLCAPDLAVCIGAL